MYTLTIEASNKALSVALFQGEKCIQHHSQYDTLQHSIHLAPAVDTVLNLANLSPSQLNRIVISNGPGSYTGLRIGVTFAKTLAYTLNIPLFAVSSLAVLGQSVQKYQLVVPFFDARRQHVYAGIYNQGVSQMEDTYLSIEDLCQYAYEFAQDVVFVSPNIDEYKSYIEAYATRVKFSKQVSYVKAYPEAKNMLLLIKGIDPIDAHLLTPFYVNKVEAELNWEKQQAELTAQMTLVEKSAWGKS